MLISTTNPEIGVMTTKCPDNMCTYNPERLYNASTASNHSVYDNDDKFQYKIYKFDDHPMC